MNDIPTLKAHCHHHHYRQKQSRLFLPHLLAHLSTSSSGLFAVAPNLLDKLLVTGLSIKGLPINKRWSFWSWFLSRKIQQDVEMQGPKITIFNEIAKVIVYSPTGPCLAFRFAVQCHIWIQMRLESGHFSNRRIPGNFGSNSFWMFSTFPTLINS